MMFFVLLKKSKKKQTKTRKLAEFSFLLYIFIRMLSVFLSLKRTHNGKDEMAATQINVLKLNRNNLENSKIY